MFHLLSHTDGTGGKSQLVDGFGAANELLEKHPEAYGILATTRVHSHASGSNDISIQPQQASPVLCHDPQGHFLVQIRWNTTDRASIDLPIEEMQQWYDAAR
jgi:trimethyllysine dioxygenase